MPARTVSVRPDACRSVAATVTAAAGPSAGTNGTPITYRLRIAMITVSATSTDRPAVMEQVEELIERGATATATAGAVRSSGPSPRRRGRCSRSRRG